MNLRLVHAHCQAEFSLDALRETGVLDLFKIFAEKKEEKEIFLFLQTYCTCDQEEIRLRNHILLALTKIPNGINRLRRMIKQKENLQYQQKRLYHPEERLRFCVNVANLLKTWKESVDAVTDCIGSSQEDSLAPIKEEISQFLQRPESLKWMELGEKIEGCFPFPREVLLGVNIQADYSADAFGVIGILEDGAEQTPMLGMSPIRPTRELGVLERRIAGQLEKQYRKGANRAFQFIKELDFSVIEEWTDFLDDFEFYLCGVKLFALFQERGYQQTCPVLGEEGLAARQLVNPLLALSEHRQVFPVDLACKNGAAVIISGLNRSGKTTLVKSVAQGMFLSQMGYFLPAQEWAATPKRNFLSLFSAGEAEGFTKSRFRAELDVYRQMEQTATAESAVFFNEPFTSTNFNEAIQIGIQAVERLTKKGASVFFATNMIEIPFLFLQSPSAPVVSVLTEKRADRSYAAEEKYPDFEFISRNISLEYRLSFDELLENKWDRERVRTFLKEVNAE